MECNIQTERITKCLDKLVYRTKLALSIPALMRDPILAQILSPKDLDDIAFIIFQYDGPIASHSCTNMSAFEDVKAGDMSLKNRVNPDLSIMLCTLTNYTALMPHVERIVEKMKIDNLSCLEQCLSSHGLNYLLKLETFRDLMVERMSTTAAEEISAIIRTRKFEKSNNDCLVKIADQKRLVDEKLEHEKQVRHKTEVIAQLKRELKENGLKSAALRKKQVLDSERQMVLATRAHKVKYQMLKEEEVESRELYDKALTGNMHAEKQLRDRRRKAETQLQSWLQKYDAEMAVKQEEMDEITQEYEDEFKKCQELKLKLAAQDKEFFPLMEEKEGEYHQEMTAKLETFIIEHAARVIQYAWRTTCKNREEKKQLTKLRRKMEAEKEAAARKAEIEAKKQELLAKKQRAKEKAEAKEAAKAAKLEAKANKEKQQEDEK
ncbi:dynein regulatory complex protein 10-like isoform X2 [Leguminivora glycinivorella]|uniref:dynein regulatory complex protein 10-like isoform X2 n=1 Tax=Leguminivora glycinivorella TaxID=1035111 RepID=UPI00200E49BF|nr:dynein regulatory complex protein 10-like isoform X2 [Leguminivora glycinivorella]